MTYARTNVLLYSVQYKRAMYSSRSADSGVHVIRSTVWHSTMSSTGWKHTGVPVPLYSHILLRERSWSWRSETLRFLHSAEFRQWLETSNMTWSRGDMLLMMVYVMPFRRVVHVMDTRETLIQNGEVQQGIVPPRISARCEGSQLPPPLSNGPFKTNGTSTFKLRLYSL